MRDWDLVSQYANTVQQQQQPKGGGTKNDDDETSGISNKKPLPNVFLNPCHYMAAWAPLCLAECRAQILQEVSGT